MAVEVSPAFIQAKEYSAEVTRRATFGAFLQRGATIGSILGGLVSGTDLQVTYAGSGLKVEVAPGEIFVPGSSSATQSGYYLRNTSALTLTPAAANASNPRIERVVAVIKDKAYAGTEDVGEIKLVEGVATAGATLTNLNGVAAAPVSSYTLGYVLIPAAATTINNTDIKNVAAPLLGLWAPQVIESASSVTATNGQLVKATAAITVTIPSAAPAGTTIGVLANEHEVTVKPAAGTISGDFFSAASEVKLVGYQHLQLVSDGTNWFVTAGEPEREQRWSGAIAYTQAALEAGVLLPSTRPVFAQAYCTLEGGTPPVVEVGPTKAEARFGGIVPLASTGSTLLYLPVGNKIFAKRELKIATISL